MEGIARLREEAAAAASEASALDPPREESANRSLTEGVAFLAGTGADDGATEAGGGLELIGGIELLTVAAAAAAAAAASAAALAVEDAAGLPSDLEDDDDKRLASEARDTRLRSEGGSNSPRSSRSKDCSVVGPIVAELVAVDVEDTIESLPTEDPTDALLEDPVEERPAMTTPLLAAAAAPAAVSCTDIVPVDPDGDVDELHGDLTDDLDEVEVRLAEAEMSFGRIGFAADRWNSVSRARRLVTCENSLASQ